MESSPFIQYAVVLLLAAVIAVPLAKRTRLGAVLGYLAAGALIGPSLLNLIGNAEEIAHISELGIILMLFVIGLELSPQRLWVMRRQVFGFGSVQVVLSALVIGSICLAFGLHWKVALVIGLGLALSSTAIGLQILAERKELQSPHGRLGFAILLFQDVAAIPILALVPLLAVSQGADNSLPTWAIVLRVVATIAIVIVGGRLLLRPLFRIAARTQLPEVFTACTLLVVLGTAWFAQLGGISMSLGAFLAGVLLADSEYRHEIEARIDPFKGLLLGLFFMSVGMTADIHLAIREPLLIVTILAGLIAIKGLILFGVGRLAGEANDSSLKLAAVLAQGGEFAFVVFTLAVQNQLLDTHLRNVLIVAITLSMAVTPLLVIGFARLKPKQTAAKPVYDQIDEDELPRVIIAGFGRFGQIIARVLRANQISFTAIESSIEQVEFSRRFGNKIYYGDPSRSDLLRSANVGKAEVFIVTTDDPETNIRTVRLVRQLYPELKVFARARNRQHAFRLMDLGAKVVRETFHSSLAMTQHVLEQLGLDAALAARRVDTFREFDEKLLLEQHLFYDDEAAIIQNARDAQQDLNRLFEADMARDRRSGKEAES
ncbi:MAG TPA: monovalent cation:proton antiporter-2 (CPA2) family protein [Dokdonella sp.]|uniref:monovalent cation:proton antiporter-2 (CPA2) family protein n=1 Tax=Dokdonella sp. TaxID=2291710 RepID=UPI002D7EDC5F|nr:monovalent cation:proton antiporter-2 (CPA2) family protein [Dokdonella sp.]HET9031401.1 monovalent cation:proton antiporter-2 (CPA2) family protein [Dokdonella sp.]